MKGRLIFLIVFVLITGILTAQNFITGKNEVPVFHPDSADFVVAQDGSGDFVTVQAAIDAVPAYRKKCPNAVGSLFFQAVAGAFEDHA